MVAAGRRDRRITLRKASLTYDGYNQPVHGDAYLADVWASWRRASARERLASGQVGAQATDIFEIIWSPTVATLNAKDRLEYHGLIYDILDVAEIGRREGLTITAAARTDLE